jgi:hypothetical protein
MDGHILTRARMQDRGQESVERSTLAFPRALFGRG